MRLQHGLCADFFFVIHRLSSEVSGGRGDDEARLGQWIVEVPSKPAKLRCARTPCQADPQAPELDVAVPARSVLRNMAPSIDSSGFLTSHCSHGLGSPSRSIGPRVHVAKPATISTQACMFAAK
jgi:hypothetical protein